MSSRDGLTDNIVQNSLLTAVARVSMALFLPTVGLVGWLYAGTLDSRFVAQSERIFRLEDKVDKTFDITNNLVTTVREMQAASTRGRDARDKENAAMVAATARLIDSTDDLEDRLTDIEKVAVERGQIIKNLIETVIDLKNRQRSDLTQSPQTRAFKPQPDASASAWPRNLVPR